jgi:hypothetical protein
LKGGHNVNTYEINKLVTDIHDVNKKTHKNIFVCIIFLLNDILRYMYMHELKCVFSCSVFSQQNLYFTAVKHIWCLSGQPTIHKR